MVVKYSQRRQPLRIYLAFMGSVFCRRLGLFFFILFTCQPANKGTANWVQKETYLFRLYFNLTFMTNFIASQIPIDFTSQALTRGPIAVDTFFMMGGLLVSYTFMRDMNRNNENFNLLSFYFHRYIRFIYYILRFSFSFVFVSSSSYLLLESLRSICFTLDFLPLC